VDINNGNKFSQLYADNLSLSENIAKSFRVILFDSHCSESSFRL